MTAVVGADNGRPRILIIGGGYVGMYTALRLLKKLRPGEADVTVVDPRSYMTYQPFLAEAAAGSVQPRHVVVPLRRVLDGAEVITGEVVRLDHPRRVAVVAPLEGAEFEVSYDQVVVAVGSISRTLPIPGLAEWGTGFKNVEEAIELRNRAVECLDIAESTRDAAIRRRNLSFVFVGGGYAGVEALGELQDMVRYTTRYYRTIRPADLRWILVEASNRILPEVGLDMAVYTMNELRRRGIEVKLETRLTSCVDGHVVLSDGTELDADTLVWTAGVKPNPLVGMTGFAVDDRGRLKATAALQVDGQPGAWAAGDAAAVPDLTGPPGATTGPSAQHAVRQARRLGDNILAALRGEQLHDYRHKYVGSVASLGLYKGVAQVYGIKLKGPIAWFGHRTYHVSRIPTTARKVQIVADWTQALLFRREIVSLWSMHQPVKLSAEAGAPDPPAPAAVPAEAGHTLDVTQSSGAEASDPAR